MQFGHASDMCSAPHCISHSADRGPGRVSAVAWFLPSIRKDPGSSPGATRFRIRLNLLAFSGYGFRFLVVCCKSGGENDGMCFKDRAMPSYPINNQS